MLNTRKVLPQVSRRGIGLRVCFRSVQLVRRVSFSAIKWQQVIKAKKQTSKPEYARELFGTISTVNFDISTLSTNRETTFNSMQRVVQKPHWAPPKVYHFYHAIAFQRSVFVEVVQLPSDVTHAFRMIPTIQQNNRRSCP